MRLAQVSIVLFGVTLVGCATDASEPETAEHQSASSVAKVTEHWDSSANDINTIWPTNIPIQNGATITNTYVLIKGVPPDPYIGPQVLAFVVWNGSYVGHIYRAAKGAEVANLLQMRDVAYSQRNTGPNTDAGGTGSPWVEPNPPPHPVGDCCEFVISADEVENSKLNAQAIHNANVNFATFERPAL
jgi:hypothetical protein